MFFQQSGAEEACWAHNPEVGGSKPPSATYQFYRLVPVIRACPGVEPGTSRTRSANHTTRPTGLTNHSMDRHPSIAQLVERETVERHLHADISRSLVQIRLEGNLFSLLINWNEINSPLHVIAFILQVCTKSVSEVGFEPTPTFVDQNAPCIMEECTLESGALDRSAILTIDVSKFWKVHINSVLC